jgi:hypothetical protein
MRSLICAFGKRVALVHKGTLIIASALLWSSAAPLFQTVAQTPLTPLPVEGVGQPNNQLNPNRGHFSLGIFQEGGNSPIIARISLKSQRPNAFLQERLVGDFRYQINQRAQFIRGLNAGDRVVVRLFAPENELIGYSEFELLSDFAVVHLILASQQSDTRTVRTVYGIDADQNNVIDPNTPGYDYFTQVTGSSLGNSRVTFLGSNQTVNTHLFRAEALPQPPEMGMYSDSFRSGTFALLDRTVAVFPSSLAPALTALPGQMVQTTSLSASSLSIYEVSRLVLLYREVGVSQGVIVQIEDAATDDRAAP